MPALTSAECCQADLRLDADRKGDIPKVFNYKTIAADAEYEPEQPMHGS